MGDLDADTAVVGGDGSYRAELSEDWGIWGPNGGYIAAILLRAAGAQAAMPRPASLSVQFLARGAFDTVELTTRTLRRTRRAEAVTVLMTQGDRPVADAMAWFVDDHLPGLEHDVTAPPAMPRPADLPTLEERLRAAGTAGPEFRFWDNVEHRPADWTTTWPPPGPLPPTAQSWFRFRPRATFADRLVDASRLVVVLDTMGWPAATRAHAWAWPLGSQPWVAPSLDLHVQFHRFAAESEQLFARVEAPLGEAGLIAAEGRVWSEDGVALASATSHLLCSEVPAG